MKRLAMLLLVLTLTACESSRVVNGKEVACYGLNGEPKAGIQYEYSVRNIVVGVLFWELLAPPIIVALSETKCPRVLPS